MITAWRNRLATEKKRVIAVLSICTVFALAGLANADIARSKVVEAPPLDVNVSSAVVASGASSSAWYCAGPLPIGTRGETSSIAIANISDNAVTGELDVATVSGRTKTLPVAVAGHAQAVLALPRTGPADFAAVTAIMNEAGVGVSEIVHTGASVNATPCVTHPTSDAYLAVGGTKDPSNVTLALYDPGSTPAVASVTFATSSGPISPPIFQGLSVLARQVILVNVGHYVYMKQVVASIVRAAGGHVVVGAIDTVPFASGVASSLTTATSATATQWYLSAAPDGPATRQSFYVLNPTGKTAHVLAHLVSTSGAADVNVTVAANGVSLFGLAPDPVPTALRWAIIRSTNAIPIVVGRATTITSSVPAAKPPAIANTTTSVATKKTAGAKKTATTTKPVLLPLAIRATLLPQLAPGYAVTTATSSIAQSWLLPGGEVDPQDAEIVTITNPSTTVAHVALRSLTVATGEPGLQGLPIFLRVNVDPEQTVSIALSTFVATRYSVPVVIEANIPVISGAIVYAKGSSGSAGFNASAAIPVD